MLLILSNKFLSITNPKNEKNKTKNRKKKKESEYYIKLIIKISILQGIFPKPFI